jgi:hypothetical protein
MNLIVRGLQTALLVTRGLAGIAPTAPTVVSTNPANGQGGIVTSIHPTVTFSEAMDSSTVTTTTITLYHGDTQVSGTVSYNGGTFTATFTPGATLGAGMLYTLTITTGAHASGGTPLGSAYVFSFVTAGGRKPRWFPGLYIRHRLAR